MLETFRTNILAKCIYQTLTGVNWTENDTLAFNLHLLLSVE